MKQALASLLLVAAAGAAQANPIDAFGFGSRAAAMGGASTATCDDASCSYYNPAGLVRGNDLRIDFGYRYADPMLRMNGRDVGVDSARGITFGLVAPGSLGPVRFAFGVAASLPDQRLVRIRSVAFQQPRFIYYDNRPQRMFLSANLAIQIIPGLYIGGGVTFLSRTQGQVGIEGHVAYSNPDESALTDNINVGLFAVRYPEAGLLWEVTRWLTLGASYRHSFTLTLDQQFGISGSVGNEGVAPLIPHGTFTTHALVSDHFQPWQLTVGGAVHLRRWLVTVDLTYARWSEFSAPELLAISLDIPPLNGLVHLTPPRAYPPPNFHDIVIPRLGVEWRAHEWGRLSLDLRAGYSYEPTPAPEQRGESNLADGDKHTFSVGAGVNLERLGAILPGSLSLDAHFACTWLPPRVNQKEDPLDAVGDFTSDGVVLQAGLMLRSRF